MAVIVSKAHRKLLVPAVPGAVTLFPSAQRIGWNNRDYVVIDHSAPNVVLVKHLGMQAPSPLMHYDWCNGKPFDVQRATCEMLVESPRAYVLNHMGTGKTKAALWAWDFLNREGLCGKMLVCAPLSTLRFVWEREVFRTMPFRKAAVLHGDKKRRLERLDADADIYVINHDGVKVIFDELMARKDIDTLVLDELAVYRNNSDRSKLMRQLAARFNIVWGMTGAPMPNAPTDVWAQCKIVTPHTVPKYFRHAQDILMQKVTQFKYVPRHDAVENAFRWMQPSVRFSLDDVVELPPVIERTIDVELTDEQRKAYDKMASQCQALVKEKVITAVNAGVAMGKLLQIACGWVYGVDQAILKLDAKPRMEALLDIINGNERKVIVFVPYRHALSGISTILTTEGIEHCTVHGQTPDRDSLFNAFQNTDKYKVLLAHPECIAHGLTLTVADTVVWYSPLASLDIYDQANARIRRVGQKHKQQILHLQGTPVERKIYALLRGKARVQDQLLDMFEQASEWRTAA